MKKYYIIISAFCSITAGFAQVSKKIVAADVMAGDAQIAVEKVKTDESDAQNSTETEKKYRVSNRGNVNYAAQIRIGSTYYDLQTNYAVGRRLILHSDGSVSATWTTSSNDVAGFPQRGSGFNFRNSAGVWNKSDSNRAENVRTGWPSIGLLSDGREFIIGHEANQGGFYISKSSNRGDRPSGSTLILQEVPLKPIWGRGANNGDTLHFIHSYSDSSASGDARAPLRKGIRAPMVYNRSLDGGVNWDIQKLMLPGYDSTLTNNGGADQYAIDCKGNTVAIVNGDNLQGVIVWKSTDFGSNWTRIIVDTFAYAPYSAKKLMLDTPYTNDGTVDVLIDDAGKLHVFWGLGRVFDEDTTDESYSFYPGIQGLAHWDEATDVTRIIANGVLFDRDGSGFNTLAAETFQSLSATGNPPSGLNTVARLGNTSCMRQPSASIDANGNLYCVFSVPIEQDLSDLNANFRDIAVVFSEDGGLTWSNPQNITQVLGREDDFACVTRKSNNFLHVMWQQDEYPGTNLQNNSTSFGNHPVTLNKILYQAIPLTDILNETIGMVWGVNVEEPNTGEVMVVSQNYPNPFSGSTVVTIHLAKPGDVAVNVRNTTGALVKSFNIAQLYKGNHAIEIDGSALPAGIYTYTITSGGSSVSRTMMVK